MDIFEIRLFKDENDFNNRISCYCERAKGTKEEIQNNQNDGKEENPDEEINTPSTPNDNDSKQENEINNNQEPVPQDKPLYEKMIVPAVIGGITLVGIGLVFKKRF